MPDSKILIVDDTHANLIALEASLKDRGYELRLASSGTDALNLISSEEFACVLLDVQMPQMDGFETAREIRKIERQRCTPIIIMTAKYPAESDVMRGYDVGAVDYLVKPLNMDIVQAKVDFFVEMQRINKVNRRQALEIAEWERKEAARVKQRSENRYQNLVEGIEDGIVWIADTNMDRFAFVSRYGERITGFSYDQWMNDDGFWFSRIHPDDRQRVTHAVLSVGALPGSQTVEHRFIKADGTIAWLRTSIRLDQSEGCVPTLQGLSIDITHLKDVETALRSAIRARDEFLSIASHELKTPITPLQLQMQAYVRFIETGRFGELSEEDLCQMLKQAGSQVTRLSRLIKQLLEVSRIDIGRFQLNFRKSELGEIVQEVVRQFYYEILASGCSVDVEITDNIFAEIDSLRYEQVIVNILSNALKYAAGKPINISLTATDRGTAILTVADQGIGIEKAHHERIFERYERAISERHYGGLGLGLYICAQIINSHGGRLWVESELGHGATFFVEVPLKANRSKNYYWPQTGSQESSYAPNH